jgi:hypothetical protein
LEKIVKYSYSKRLDLSESFIEVPDKDNPLKTVDKKIKRNISKKSILEFMFIMYIDSINSL